MSAWVDYLAVLVWNAFAWVIWAAATVEVLRTPAAHFARGWTTKIVRLVVILTFSGVIAGLYLPVGAAVVLAGLRRARRQSQVPPLPPAPQRGPQLPQ